MRLSKVFVFLLIAMISNIKYGLAQAQRSFNSDEIVAIINGKVVITQREIDNLIASQVYNLQEKIYSLRKSALNQLITRVLLEQEARSRGIGVEELKKQIIPDKVDIPQSQINQIYAETVNGLGNMSEDEAKERIRLDLESREKIERYKAFIADIRNKAKLYESYSKMLS